MCSTDRQAYYFDSHADAIGQCEYAVLVRMDGKVRVQVCKFEGWVGSMEFF